MMRQLFISDLDGTLFNSQAKISEKSADLLNNSIDGGIFFTFATARTAASVVPLTKSIRVNVPCVLMNGVSIFDAKNCQYIRNEYISPENSARIASVLERLGQNGFMYKICGNSLFCEYTELDSPAMENFYNVRKYKYDKQFCKVSRFSDSCSENVVYFTLLDSFEKLDKVRQQISLIDGIRFEFYKDIYSSNIWYLEIFSDKASKFNGVDYLRKNFHFDKIICFGDNLNDIPMFNACDYKIAVSNADKRLKELADCVIGSNNEDAVAVWLSQNL